MSQSASRVRHGNEESTPHTQTQEDEVNDFMLIYQGGDPSWTERSPGGPRIRVSTEIKRPDFSSEEVFDIGLERHGRLVGCRFGRSPVGEARLHQGHQVVSVCPIATRVRARNIPALRP
jgi:hypothetical protein